MKRVILSCLLLVCLASATIAVYIAPANASVISQSTTLLSFPSGTSCGEVEYYKGTDLTFIITWTISRSDPNPLRVDMLIFSNDASFNTWMSNLSVEAVSGFAYRHVSNMQDFGNFSTGSMSISDPAQFPSSGGITNCDIMFINLGNTSAVNMKYSVTVEWDLVGRVIRPILPIALAITAVIVTVGIASTKKKHSPLPRKSNQEGHQRLKVDAGGLWLLPEEERRLEITKLLSRYG